jgi:eukaryotic-like serine/threonine-protein kinase
VTSTNGVDDKAVTVPQPATPFTPPPADDALLGATTPIPRAAATMPTEPVRVRGSGLFWKIFAAVAGTVGLVMAITLVVGGTQSKKAAETSLHQGLAQTAQLITDLIKADEDNLAAKAKIYVANPAIRGVIEQTGLDSVPKGTAPLDSGNFLDIATTMAQQVGASWVQIIDRNGFLLARSDMPGAPVADLSESALVNKALGGETMHGFGLTGDSVLFDAVSIPISGAGKTVGVAMLARNITDSTALRVMSLTGSEVVFFAIDGTNKHVRIVGATPRLADRTRTSGVLTTLIAGDRKAAADSMAGQMGDMLMGMEMDNHMGSTMAKESTIDGHTYVWTIKPLLTAAEVPRGGVVALRDKDEALTPFTTMQKFVLIAAGIALALAVLISILVAGQITRPVRTLVGATMRATEGDYNAEIPESGGEIGALAEAFRHLLEDLREKQSVVDFLQSPSGGRTVQAQANRMSVGVDTSTRSGAGVEKLEPGSMLANRFEIKRVLGAGGMGMVYKAVDKELGETVAIKTLRPEIMGQDPAALDRFRSEIRLARKISHRNVVRTHDIGESNGLYYISMEFVEGSSLKDLIMSRGRLPAGAVVAIGKQLCRALEVAHEAGVIHRDIKPQNMVVEADGVLKVMDFGIARLQARSEGHTQAGMVVGTPEYMSPEQLRGDDLDARSDLYSAGVVLYESLTGRLPHVADTPGALIGKVLSETPAPPRASVSEVSPALSGIIMQALSKDREQRPRTALEFLALLERA